MKLPLRFGIPLLVGLLLISSYTGYDQGKTLFLLLAMVVALWTAFSLPRPRRHQEPEEDREGPFWLKDVPEEDEEEDSIAPPQEEDGQNTRKTRPPQD